MTKPLQGMMVKKTIGQTADEERANLSVGDVSIRESLQSELDADKLARIQRGKLAVEWITVNRPDLTFGATPRLLQISFPDNGGLQEFEAYGEAGNAVLLHKASFGEIWWCDPECREVLTSKFAVRPNVSGPIDYEIRFSKS